MTYERLPLVLPGARRFGSPGACTHKPAGAGRPLAL